MDQPNPFASPLSEDSPLGGGPQGKLWSDDGKTLWAAEGADFPDRCVKCNSPADGYRLKKTYSWHPPWIFFLLLLNILIYALVAVMNTQKAKLAVGLCEHHRRVRFRCLLVAWATAFLGIVFLFLGLVQESPLLFIACPVFLLAGAITGIVGGRVLVPKRIERRGMAHLRGAGPEFLLSLPR